MNASNRAKRRAYARVDGLEQVGAHVHDGAHQQAARAAARNGQLLRRREVRAAKNNRQGSAVVTLGARLACLPDEVLGRGDEVVEGVLLAQELAQLIPLQTATSEQSLSRRQSKLTSGGPFRLRRGCARPQTRRRGPAAAAGSR